MYLMLLSRGMATIIHVCVLILFGVYNQITFCMCNYMVNEKH